MWPRGRYATLLSEVWCRDRIDVFCSATPGSPSGAPDGHDSLLEEPSLPTREQDPPALPPGDPSGWLHLERADIDDLAAVAVAIARPADAALVHGGGAVVIAVVDGQAPRQQGARLGRPTVVG